MPAAIFGPSVERDGRLLAAIVFHDWQPHLRTMQVSGAAVSPMWARPKNIRDLYRYAFVTAGTHLLWTATPEDLPAWRFDKNIGMTEDGTLRHRFGPDRHAVICSITVDEWRQSRWYTGEEHGKAVAPAAACA